MEEWYIGICIWYAELQIQFGQFWHRTENVVHSSAVYWYIYVNTVLEKS